MTIFSALATDGAAMAIAATAATINPSFFMMSPLLQLGTRRTSNVRHRSDGTREKFLNVCSDCVEFPAAQAVEELTRYSMIA
jgi:hypothetical protein